jgi:hypothetical protein
MTIAPSHGLKYKEDLSLALERHRAFWEHEIIDRVCLSVTAPAEPRALVPEPEQESTLYVSDEQFLTDPDYIVRLTNAQMANTYYGGDALPWASAPGNLLYAAYGGQASFASRTVWMDPTLTSGDQWADYRFDPANRFIEYTLRITRALAADGVGKYLVASPGVFGPLDAMAQVRGMSDFVMELALAEYAAPIRHAFRACLAGFKYISEAIYAAATNGQPGHALFGGIWASGRINNWSADFSCIIGPRQIRQWLLPELEAMAGFLEYNMYHLDGPNAARHLPILLEVGLQGIAYARGAGHTLVEAMPVYKQIQQAGRLQTVDCAYDEVEWVLQELDPRGLMIFTHAPSVEAADALVKNAERWSRR